MMVVYLSSKNKTVLGQRFMKITSIQLQVNKAINREKIDIDLSNIVNSVAWAPHELGAILACASSDGKISILEYNGTQTK